MGVKIRSFCFYESNIFVFHFVHTRWFTQLDNKNFHENNWMSTQDYLYFSFVRAFRFLMFSSENVKLAENDLQDYF